VGRALYRDEFSPEDFARFGERLRENLAALRTVLTRPEFGEGPATLGAELELSIVDRDGRACTINEQLRRAVGDPRLQLELDRFNLEYNFAPVRAAGQPFRALEHDIGRVLATVGDAAREHGARIVPIGILPTLAEADLGPSSLTDVPRYRALSAAVRRYRPVPIRIRIAGEDPLDVSCNDVTLEGANTSFQVHLRVPPAQFAECYNAAQVATPLALAVAVNSPLLLGHRLWDETRVALFKKAMDVRDLEALQWHPPARVSFGHGWMREGAYEAFAESASLFPVLFPLLGEQDDPRGVAESGGVPTLDELRLHQGTVWRWNRPIYDPDAGGHLRIEFRALPGGPTPIDMAANAALLVGLTLGLRSELPRLLPALPFALAEYNFYRAAQHGLNACLLWPCEVAPSPREVPVRDLLTGLLPIAERGLASIEVDREESTRLLGIVRERLECATTAARWQRRALARWDDGPPTPDSLHRLLDNYLARSATGHPLHTWAEAG
jgi:gamma-glutamyl:cysteine ligase YbdK (ATP-grasp superfamily)